MAIETRQNLPIMLIYPLRTEIRLSSSGVQNGLRALSILNVLRNLNVSTIFSEVAKRSAAFPPRTCSACLQAGIVESRRCPPEGGRYTDYADSYCAAQRPEVLDVRKRARSRPD